MGLKKKFSRHREAQPSHTDGQLVRAAFGLTQLQLALLLGVSREALAADEMGRRYLMGPAAILMSQLGQIVRAAPPEEAAPGPPPAPVLLEYDRETLRLRLMGIGLEQYRLRQQLARCQTRLAQARRRRQSLAALQAVLPDNAYATQWLARFAEEATSTLSLEEPQAALLAMRLRLLAFEAAELEKLLAATV